MRTPVIAGVDTAPVLQATKHDLDLVALAVKHGIVRYGHSPVCPGGDACSDLAIGQGGAELVCVIASVAEQVLALGSASSISAAPL